MLAENHYKWSLEHASGDYHLSMSYFCPLLPLAQRVQQNVMWRPMTTVLSKPEKGRLQKSSADLGKQENMHCVSSKRIY